MSKTFRLSKMPRDKALACTNKVIHRFLKDLDTPVSLHILSLYNSGRHEELLEVSIVPEDYDDVVSFAKDYAAIKFLSKADFLKTSFNREQRALDKFYESELQCSRTNQRLLGLKDHDFFSRSWAPLMLLTQQKISSILGNLPDLKTLDYRFGPGASSTCKGSSTTIGDKLQSQISLTENCRKIFVSVASSLPHLVFSALGFSDCEGPATFLGKDAVLNVVFTTGEDVISYTDELQTEYGNRFTTVPKNSKIDRAICIEPHTNILLQKGVGRCIRDRLRKFGLDLDTQADKNAVFARRGSIDGSYATIDLSNASDTIAWSTVFELFPREWFDVLDSLRSPATQMPSGRWLVNEKFSSMGNGFTFEMESLLFYAISLAVKQHYSIEGEVMSFGDDIIVPTHMAQELIEFLGFLGFSVNKEKTYLHGPFRESCGKDYFLGHNVRPFFLKEVVSYETDFIKIANGISHFSSRLCLDATFRDRRLYRTWSVCVGFVPTDYRFFGPDYLGDQVIWNSRECSAGSYTIWYWTMQTKILVRVANVKGVNSFTPSTQRAVSLYPGSSEKLSPRGDSGRYQIKTVTIPNWEWSKGSWVIFT